MVSQSGITPFPPRPSGVPSRPTISKTKFGSRAPRHSKQTQFIRSRQAKSYEKAVERAAIPSLSFVFVTVWWGGINRSGQDDLASVLWLRELARKWLGQPGRGVKFYDLGVRELAAVKGPHWHWLIHCPAFLRRDFDKYIRGLLSPSSKGAVQIRKPPRLADCEGCGRARDMQHLARCYFLKAGSDTVRERNGITLCAAAAPDVYAQDQGTLTGKRLFHSRSLGDKANRVRVAGGVRLKNNQPKSIPGSISAAQ